MRKIIIRTSLILGVILLTVLCLGVYKFNIANDDVSFNTETPASLDNATYKINGENVLLKNGISVTEVVPGSASKTVTRYFGNEVKHDFDGDGREDSAFLVTQETGGSGIFYYLVARLNTVHGYIGSEGVFLGDRIAPQTTEMGKGNIIVVNYAERAKGESFAVRPSFGKSRWLLLDPKTMQFGEVAQNFEGEADPARMTLGMKTWDWIHTTYGDGTQVQPHALKKFTLLFKKDNTFSLGTDCNSGGGGYVMNGNKISFEKMISTMMYCDGSQEADFTKMLGEVLSYHFTSRGELVFDLKLDSGVMVFR